MYMILSETNWLIDYHLTYTGVPHFEFNPKLNLLYLLQLGYYIQLLISLLFIDERLDDFYEMLTHHIATLVLVSLSYLCLWHRPGAIIFFIHDLGDCFLYVGKMCHNAGWEKAASIIFPGFVLSFILTRIIYLPIYFYGLTHSDYAIANPAFYFPSNDLGTFINFDGVCFNGHCMSLFWFIVYHLGALICLHMYWLYRIFLLIIDTLKNSGIVPGDPRYKSKKKDL